MMSMTEDDCSDSLDNTVLDFIYPFFFFLDRDKGDAVFVLFDFLTVLLCNMFIFKNNEMLACHHFLGRCQ